MRFELLSVNVGRPAPLGVWQGEPVISAIRKAPVAHTEIVVTVTNLEGDAQADLRVHGGPDKALYSYPADHWAWWLSTANFRAGPAAFGENLTIRGGSEEDVRIGDQFQWGPVVVEVSQPRAPCHKFSLLTKREDLGARMTMSARTGWYFRVLKAGLAGTRVPLERIKTDEEMPSVRDAFVSAYHPRVPRELIEKAAGAPALAEV